ncbi:hypothetical protein F4818DRAFT_457687 [Hypoxylon cercidicola]|nr:hypothetical protein F4818DRAFT_457687 [Hypoxylon cercidicola]
MAPQTELEPKCSSCKGGSPPDLSLCAGCEQARYCSRDCQKQDWENHKTFCQHVSTKGASSKSLDMVEYHLRVAAHDPKANALARDVGISLPTSSSEFRGPPFAMKRLVVTGKDTPENMSLFFGQHRLVPETQKHARLDVLLRPPPGSAMYFLSKTSEHDENCPPWTPRETSAAEAKEIEEIGTMQGVLRSHMGARGVGNISTEEMLDILAKNFGNPSMARLQTYATAINSMDRGYKT